MTSCGSRGRARPCSRPVELGPAILDASASAEAAADGACAGIDVPATVAIVRADREMLRSVLLNLLLNACQSGSRDRIEVEVLSFGDTCQIDIADRGTGLGDVDPELLFQAFHTTKTSGTGLGLAIVRRLLSLQGGTVAVETARRRRRYRPRDASARVCRILTQEHGGENHHPEQERRPTFPRVTRGRRPRLDRRPLAV